MKLIIPLAADATDFKTFKPFVMVQNQPLISLIMRQHDISYYSSITFIIRKDQEQRYQITKQLHQFFSFSFEIKQIDYKTNGAPCTILKAMESEITHDEPILVELADVLRDLTPLYAQLGNTPQLTHIVPVQSHTYFKNRLWGYVELKGGSEDVAVLNEKITPSKPGIATMGLYHFARGQDFVRAARNMMQNKSFLYKNNYFVGPVYNELIKSGHDVQMCEVNIKALLGNPEDVIKLDSF